MENYKVGLEQKLSLSEKMITEENTLLESLNLKGKALRVGEILKEITSVLTG